MPNPVNELLSDERFSQLDPTDQEDLLRGALGTDKEYRSLPQPDQEEIFRDLLKSVRPPEPSFTQKAKGGLAAIGKGVLSIPEETASLPISLLEMAGNMPTLAVPYSLPAQEPVLGQPTPLAPTTGKGFDEYAIETGLPTSKEALSPVREFAAETRKQFESGKGLVSRESIRNLFGVPQIEQKLGIPQALEQSQLNPVVETGLEIAGGIGAGAAPMILKKTLGKTIREGEGLPTGSISKGKGQTTKPFTTSKILPHDTVIKDNVLSPPKILSQETADESRIAADMVTRNELGIYEPAFDSPLYDLKPAKGKPKRNILGLDALSRIDRMPGMRGAGEFLRRTKSKWEQRTMSSYVDFDNNLTQIWGKRYRFDPTRLNPFRTPGIQERYRISKREVKALVDYMYSEGEDLAPLANLSPESAQKVQLTAQLLFEQGTKSRIQNAMDLGIEVKRFNPETGLFESVPRTKNTVFFPHIPVSAKATENINAKFLQRAYTAAKNREPALTRAEFMKRIDGFSEINTDPKKFRGLEAERMFDAREAGNGSAYEGLQAFGYETDPLRAVLSYIGASDRRIVMEESRSVVNDIRYRAAQQGQKVENYVNQTINRMQGATSETIDKQTDDFLAKLRSMNTGTLLQGATLSNVNQMAFIANKVGVLNTIKAAMGRATPRFIQPNKLRAQDEIVKRSGAIFNQIAAEFAQPSHLFSKYAQGQLFMNGFSATERWMRAVAAHGGVMEASSLIKKLKKAVDKGGLESKRVKILRQKIGNLGVNPDEIIAQNFTMSEQQALNVAQRVANQAAGRRDVGGVPLLVDSDNTFLRSLLQFKDFAFSNLAEINRQVRGEPTKARQLAKLAKLMGGGEVVGEITRDLQQIAFNSFSGNIDLSNERRVPKFLRDTVGDEWGRVIDNELAGLSSVFGIAMLAALKGEQAVGEEIGGPTIGLIQDIYTVTSTPFTGDIQKATEIVGRRIGGPPIRNALREESTPNLRKFRGTQGFSRRRFQP